MKYLDEFRDGEIARRLAGGDPCDHDAAVGDHGSLRRPDALASSATASTNCCPTGIELIHGPGCPVCVTPLDMIDKALAIAARAERDVLLSFGDMLRVPGSDRDLFQRQERGWRRAIVYSPLDAVQMARENPGRSRWSSSASGSRPRRRPTRWPCTWRRRQG